MTFPSRYASVAVRLPPDVMIVSVVDVPFRIDFTIVRLSGAQVARWTGDVAFVGSADVNPVRFVVVEPCVIEIPVTVIGEAGVVVLVIVAEMQISAWPRRSRTERPEPETVAPLAAVSVPVDSLPPFVGVSSPSERQ